MLWFSSCFLMRYSTLLSPYAVFQIVRLSVARVRGRSFVVVPIGVLLYVRLFEYLKRSPDVTTAVRKLFHNELLGGSVGPQTR